MLTELGSTTMLDKALDTLPGVQKIIIEEACAEGHADDDLGVAVAADQLAYIYFTSGSTGEPKGRCASTPACSTTSTPRSTTWGSAGAGAVVAQTAPQCFDISLWQLVSALLVGGRTLIVEQEVILDVERYVDTIVRRPGRRPAGRAVLSRGRAVLPGAASTRACRICGACRPPARR